MKWNNCPASDYNQAKGKELHPSLAFECMSNFDNQIKSVFRLQFYWFYQVLFYWVMFKLYTGDFYS